MKVVCFGQQNWDHCWTGKQQLLTRLPRRGHRVLYLDPDWSFEPRPLLDEWRALDGRRQPGLRAVGGGSLYVYTHPFVPSLGWRLNVRRHRAMVSRLVQRLWLQDPVALVMRPDPPCPVEAVDPRARVYYAVDEWTAFPGYSEEQRARLRRLEDEQLRASDLALAVSARLMRRFEPLQPDVRQLDNGADVDHFAPARLERIGLDPAVGSIPTPRIGFVGQVDERIDAELVAALAAARPDWSLVLVGRRRQGAAEHLARLGQLPNVHLLGYRPYEDLPGALAGFDVCMIPYVEDELTHACSPLKAYEYLASGKPVVATPLEGLAPLAGVVERARGAEAWIAALERALARPDQGREARLAAARGASWDVRVDELEGHLNEALERGAARRAPRRLPRRTGPLEHPELYHDYGKEMQAERPSRLARVAFEGAKAVGRVLQGGRALARAATGRRGRIRSVLVVRNAWLGDTLTLLPGLRALRAAFPEARLVLGVQPGMSAHALIEPELRIEVLELDFLSAGGGLARLRAALSVFMQGFDAVVSGQEYFLRREAFFLGAPHRVGVYDGHPLQLWNQQVVLHDRNRHESETLIELASVLSGRPRAELAAAASPDLRVDLARVRDTGARLLAQLGLPAGRRFVAVHPGAAKASRRWSAERFGAVVDGLLDAHPELDVVVTGSEAELELAERLRAQVGRGRRDRLHLASGRTDLDELTALLARAELLVCNDTGAMHLGRALGTPLLTLFGPENERRWGPHSEGRAPAVVLRHVVPCAPCARQHCGAHFCMRSLTVESVLAEALALLEVAARGELANGSVQARRTHESWERLAEAGFVLPRMAVLVTSRAGGAAAIESLARQGYPALEPILVEDQPLAMRKHDDDAPPRLTLPDPDMHAAWSRALACTDAEFIAVMRDQEWPADRCGAHVAALLQQPEADFAVTRGAPIDLTLRRTGALRALSSGRSAGVPWISPRALETLVSDLRGATVEVTGRRGGPSSERPRPRPVRRADGLSRSHTLELSS